MNEPLPDASGASSGSQPILFETALQAADAAVLATASRHLKNIEVAVLKGAWHGFKYDEIAEETGYTPEYIKHDVGPKLWQLLSSSLGERVSKTNLVAVLSQRAVRPNGSANSSANSSPIGSVILPNGAAGSGVSDGGAIASPGLASTVRPQDLDRPVGLVALNSPVYVDRPPSETRCYDEISRPGALIRIKAPSQMGKTSLMVRVLDQARRLSEGGNSPIHTVALSLQQADSQALNDLDGFLRWFCALITRKLRLPHRVDEYWSPTFGSKGNCTAYFEDCLLPDLNAPLVLALDRVDDVFLHPQIAHDFFALLRAWYEEAAYGDSGNPLWQHLRLVIVHSTEVYLPLDINQSPFNVGLAVELQEFTPAQVTDLAQRYGLSLADADLERLQELVGGHPYLVHRAVYHLARQDLTLDEFWQTAPTDSGIYSNHLHRLLRQLQEHPDLAATFNQVAKSSAPIEVEQMQAFKLRSMGLVHLHGNRVALSYGLYRRYFGNITP
ncbi:MAG: AAA-like domain-containing protein [Cyanobacteriota bacterium]